MVKQILRILFEIGVSFERKQNIDKFKILSNTEYHSMISDEND